MRYRPEIDGLRAVAVVPVILFHAGFSAFSGGFVGVDVFFVISGYLITTILIEERRGGRISIVNFYERRARRILPALFVVMACCVPFAIWWMPTHPLEDFSRSMVFASFFASNIHFLEKSGGYFSLRSELQPLLHTWSLAVEEQFYLIFPLLLGLLMKWKMRVVVIGLTVIALLSLGLSEWGSRNYRAANFFFTFSRFWELLAGSLCAVYLIDRPVKERGALAALGLVMIIASVFLFGPSVPFPSVYAVVPVIGTLAIILFAAGGSTCGRFLSWSPVVGIGLISYSAYLWHQPLFAFARIRSIDEPSVALMIGFAIAAFGLAYFSWRFIERPFRKPTVKLFQQRGFIFATGGVISAGFVAFGIYGMHTKGMPQRLLGGTGSYFAEALTSLDQLPEYHDCSSRALPSEPGQLYCTAFAPATARNTIAVVGDSHAESILPAFETLAAALPARVVVGAKSACPPLLDVYTSRSRESVERCHAYARDLAELLKAEKVSAVFLVSKWSVYTGAGLHAGNPRFLLRQLPSGTPDPAQSRAVFEAALERTIAFYRDAEIPVFLVQQVPETRLPPNFFLEKLVLRGRNPQEADRIIDQSYATKAAVDTAHEYATSVLEQHEAKGVHLLSLNAPFVVDDRYKWYSEARSLYRDTSHLSLGGAQFLRDHLRQKAMELMAGKPPE